MRISFSFKLAMAIAFLSLLASVSALTYYYQEIRDSVWSEMSRRLRDIGKTGQAILTPEHREAIKRLNQKMQESQRELDQKFLNSIPVDDYEEAIPEEIAQDIARSSDYQMVTQALRLIKAGTLKEPVFPQTLDQRLNQGEDESQATLKYVYLLAPIQESPDFNIVRFVSDADYEEIDMNGNGQIDEDEVGVPAGLLYNISEQPNMLRAFREGTVQNMDAPDDDAWGVWYTAMVPVKDADGNLIAVIGLDMDINSNLNLLNKFFWLAITVMVVIFFLTGAAAYFVARFLAAPLDQLRVAAERVQERQFDTRVDVRRKDELGLLADAFNSMVREIRIYSEQMEQLVADRTARLEETLKQVQFLKDRQDGDYYLSTLLTNPLFKNRNRSRIITTDFFIRQKKQFSFRRWKAELGGDLCVSGNVRFHGSSWIVFFNGDAMGKSMQGAGGALVMGSLINSIMVRSSANNRDLDIDPVDWMSQTHAEIQRIFETFDGSMFVSGVLGIIEESTGRMYYLNAEHPLTVLMRKGVVRFLEEEISTGKFGMPESSAPEIFEFQLQPGDVLIAGSDGRDDLEISSNIEGRVINHNENLFLGICEAAGGDLNEILERLEQKGTLTDDLSMIRVEYRAVPLEAPALDDADSRSRVAMLLRAKKYEDALRLLEAGKPAGAVDLYHRALCLWKLKRPWEALKFLEEAGEELKAHGAFLRLMARTQLEVGSVSEARSYAEQALALDPSDQKARRILDSIPSRG